MGKPAGKPQQNGPRRARRRASVVTPLASVAAAIAVALGYVGYVLWPRWPEPPVAPDAPALPIVISHVVFNVPPAALRVALQRHAGEQDRIDLVFAWPSSGPPDMTAKTKSAPPRPGDRLFVTITDAKGTLAPAERLRNVYRRYTAAETSAGPDGLSVLAFRKETPYQGEDLLFDRADGEHFLVRCTRDAGAARGTCLYDRRIGGADLTVRFPRDWLPRWREVAAAIAQVIAQLRPREA